MRKSRNLKTILMRNLTNYQWPDKVILIVEDDPSSSIFLEELLKRTSVKLLFADNGQKAINICNEDTKIDLVLMDIKIPGTDGVKATKEIKKNRPELPVIAQSAITLDEEKKLAFEHGCDDYITKPLNVEELLKKIGLFFH